MNLTPVLEGMFARAVQDYTRDRYRPPSARKLYAMRRYCRRHKQARKRWDGKGQRFTTPPPNQITPNWWKDSPFDPHHPSAGNFGEFP